MGRQLKFVHLQCETAVRQGWIPATSAVMGRTITLKEEGHSTNWTVCAVFDTVMDEAQINRGWDNNI